MSASVFCPPSTKLKLAVCVLFLESSKNKLEIVAFRFPQGHLCLMVFTLVIILTMSRTATWPLLHDEGGYCASEKLILN